MKNKTIGNYSFIPSGTWWILPWHKKLVRWLRYVPIGYISAYLKYLPHTIAYILHNCGLPLKQAVILGLRIDSDGVFKPQFLISLALSCIDINLDRMYTLDHKGHPKDEG